VKFIVSLLLKLNHFKSRFKSVLNFPHFKELDLQLKVVDLNFSYILPCQEKLMFVTKSNPKT